MSFMPKMQNSIEGFSILKGPRSRTWNGVAVELWDVDCEQGAGGFYVAGDPRLFIPLNAHGGRDARFLMTPDRRGQTAYMSPKISYIPAEMEVWAHVEDISFVRHLDLHFSADVVGRRLMEDLDPVRLSEPRFAFDDERLLALAQLIAAECDNPDPLHELYGDSLTLAFLIDFLKLPPRATGRRTKLAAWQLRRAVDFIEANCLRRIKLEELAEITNLSQSHFSHAFKASTGVPPHQWQMNARVEKVKALLTSTELSLTTIAISAGFADQAHFTRVFRKHVGATPLAWQKSRQS
jgi:AraC-like DNA-binding protein